MSAIQFREIKVGTAEHSSASNLRDNVLRRPLGLALSPIELSGDGACIHLGGFQLDQLIAILLLQPLTSETMKMRQVAVRPDFQKRGIGSQLVSAAEQLAKAKGCKNIVAHARETAVGFYLRLGYIAAGESFLETTIPHRLVSKDL